MMVSYTVGEQFRENFCVELRLSMAAAGWGLMWRRQRGARRGLGASGEGSQGCCKARGINNQAEESSYEASNDVQRPLMAMHVERGAAIRETAN